MFTGRVGVLNGRVEPQCFVKRCYLGDKSGNFYYKMAEKTSFGLMGGWGGFGGFLVQRVAAPGQVSDQSSIQALFFKFLFLPPPHIE
jgi:hypothetical protein